MNRLKRYLLVIFAAALLSSPVAVYAEPETQEETTEAGSTEETTEEGTTEEASKTDASEENESEGEWYTVNERGVKRDRYKDTDGNVYTGWHKIDGSWYYFDGAGNMLSDKYIGINKLGKDGKLIGSKKIKKEPKPHGVLVKSNKIITLKNGHDDSEKVKKRINELYDDYVAKKTIEPSDVKELRGLYNSLSMAEKVWVSNESELADLENSLGITYQYQTSTSTETDALDTDDGKKTGTEYVFDITDNERSISIAIHLASELDREMLGGNPKLGLTTPDGDLIELENQKTIDQNSVKLKITNADGYTQLDIESAQKGRWVLSTDVECIFVPGEYKGEKKVFPVDKSLDETNSYTDANPSSQSTDESDNNDSSSPIGSLIILIVAIGGFAGLMVYMKKMPAGSGKSKSDEKKTTEPVKKISKEEEFELLKKELSDMSEEYSDVNYEEDMYSDDVFVKEKKEVMEFSEEEINESLEDYSASSFDMSSEDATTVLSTQEDSWSEIDSDSNETQSSMDMLEDEE